MKLKCGELRHQAGLGCTLQVPSLSLQHLSEGLVAYKRPRGKSWTLKDERDSSVAGDRN
jgi:hypothetical protein